MATSSVPQTAQRPADPFGADDDDEVNQRGDTAKSGMERLLGRLPGLLSSKPVIIFGIILFFYLFIFAGIASLTGHPTLVSANTQLILGNYTNVSSSVGAGIAASDGLTLIKHQRRPRGRPGRARVRRGDPPPLPPRAPRARRHPRPGPRPSLPPRSKRVPV